MPYEQRDNQGSLFKNERKETASHPDYRGSIKVNGVEMWIAGWLKESKNGTKYMSLGISPKEPKPTVPKAEAFQDDSDLPF